MPLTTFSTLILIANGTPVDVNNVINPDFILVNNNFNALYNYSQRSIGGGWTNTELADSSVLSRNYKPQRGTFYSAVAHSTPISNAFLEVSAFSVTTAFANAEIIIKSQQQVEPTQNSGEYLIVKRIERSTSPTFATTTIVQQTYDTRTYTQNGFHNGWSQLSDEVVDTIIIAGTYYYRYTIAIERYNNASVTSNFLAIVNNTGVIKSNFVRYEITNGSVL